MGRGSYLGGSTVISVWYGWFSGHARPTNLASATTKRAKKPAKAKHRANPKDRIARSAEVYASEVRKAVEQGRALPPPPRRLRNQFQGQTTEQIVAWAGNRQPPQKAETVDQVPLAARQSSPAGEEAEATTGVTFEEISRRSVRHNYMCNVLAARAGRSRLPNPPKRHAAWLLQEIEHVGSVDMWASAQPQFKELAARATKRAAKKKVAAGPVLAAKNRGVSSRHHVVFADSFAESAAQKHFSNLED